MESNVVDAVAAFSSSTGNSLDEVVRCIACAEHLSRSGGVDTGVAVAAFALPEFNIDRSAVVDGQRQDSRCITTVGVGPVVGLVATLGVGVNNNIIVGPLVAVASCDGSEGLTLVCIDGQVEGSGTLATVGIDEGDGLDTALGVGIADISGSNIVVGGSIKLVGRDVPGVGEALCNGLFTTGVGVDGQHEGFVCTSLVVVVLEVSRSGVLGFVPGVSVAHGDRSLRILSTGQNGYLHCSDLFCLGTGVEDVSL